ncbi:MAG TPA: aldo/keto reductase [Gemmatimonadaceae bacterium]|nr:aldo/keto reductase [Gemmatimonadaceae bacterium]
MTSRVSPPSVEPGGPHSPAAAPATEPLRGRATAAGTWRYAERFAAGHGGRGGRDAAAFAADFYRPLARDETDTRSAVVVAAAASDEGAPAIVVSSIGLGTYLGECDDRDDAAYTTTARHALERGVNVLDTAINYRCQRSERALGAALRGAVADGVMRRDEVVVCTKGGYVALDGRPPATRIEYQDYLEREFFAPGVMTPAEVVAGGHCLAPGFLAHQIERSRHNLGVATIDVYYLHNPEQQLDVVEPATFRARVRDAFALLEEKVARGEIARYGCATWNGLRAAPRTRGHLSLLELVETAREVAGDGHHFAAVQLPINLAMPEAARAATQEVRVSRGATRPAPLLEAAVALGVAVVGSATLMQAQLARGLPEPVRAAFPELSTDAQRAIAFSRALPGVATSLVGMKHVEHLEENLGAGRR